MQLFVLCLGFFSLFQRFRRFPAEVLLFISRPCNLFNQLTRLAFPLLFESIDLLLNELRGSHLARVRQGFAIQLLRLEFILGFFGPGGLLAVSLRKWCGRWFRPISPASPCQLSSWLHTRGSARG